MNNNAENSNQPMIGPQEPPPPPQQQQQDGVVEAQVVANMSNMPPAEILQLWNDVAENLIQNQTVVWTKAVDSLESSRDYLKSNPAPPTSIANSIPTSQYLSTLPPLQNTPNPGRAFVDRHMVQIISILLEQKPMQIGTMEKECVEKSIRCALQIVKDDLDIVNSIDRDNILRSSRDEQEQGGDNINNLVKLQHCSTLNALGHIFNRTKVYYKKSNSSRQWGSNQGLPELRYNMIYVFRRTRGFTALVKFMELRAGYTYSSVSSNATVGVNGGGGDGKGATSEEGDEGVLFPSMELCKDIIESIRETLPIPTNNNNNNQGNEEHDLQSSKNQHLISVAWSLSQTIMKHVLLLDEVTLKKMVSDGKVIEQIRWQLHRLYMRLNEVEPTAGGGERGKEKKTTPINEYFSFWRSLALKLITSQSLPLKLFGWNEIDRLIKDSSELAPPPRAYRVIGAGTKFCNGLYEFDKKGIGSDGYAKGGMEIQYHFVVPPTAPPVNANNDIPPPPHQGGGGPVVIPPENGPVDGAGKTLTLFRCTMRSQQKWWFLSEADPDQPGTDKDIDFYQLKSKPQHDSLPSSQGWLTCRAGNDPAPILEAVGKLVPKGMERQTMEDKLAKWAIDNGVIELVLGDGIHREVVSRSGGLIKFLAGMCDRGQSLSNVYDEETMADDEKYCLQASHLKLAWKTCTNKSDAAVSAQIYKLLVGILPELPSALAIPLIEAIRSSLDHNTNNNKAGGSGEKQSEHFYEVSEFCCAVAKRMLAETSRDNNNNNNTTAIDEDDPVAEAILTLQWSVLSHKDALTLKSYESIKNYVFSEICKQNRTTSKLRNTFIMHTLGEIIKYGNCVEPGMVDESHALHMVQLAKFLLESCNREEMEGIVVYNPNQPDVHFPALLFRDLISYMKRRRKGRMGSSVMLPVRKPSSSSVAPEFNHPHSLSTRLQILRFVYGLGLGPAGGSSNSLPENEMSNNQLKHLWDVCSQSIDREACMTFLANASKVDDGTYNKRTDGTGGELRPENSMHKISKLSPCFSDNVYIFESLFCARPNKGISDGSSSSGPGWEHLGEVAYEAFQNFDAKSARTSSLTTDALWNICLTAGNDAVASRAMNDLLFVYNGSSSTAPSEVSAKEENQFTSRIFAYLTQVKEGLALGNSPSSERSAERCIRILSAAIEQCSSLGGGANSVVERLDTLQKQSAGSGAQVEQYMNLVPHGMRGKYSCHTVSIMAKPTRGGERSGGNSSPGSPTSSGADISEVTRSKEPVRFTIQIHPLQTIASIKSQIVSHCNHDATMIKLTSITGKRAPQNGSSSNLEPRISALPDTALASTLRITDGSEIVALLTDKPVGANNNNTSNGNNDVSKEVVVVDDDPSNLSSYGPSNKEVSQQKDISSQVVPSATTSSSTLPSPKLDLTGLFSRNGVDGSSDLFFDTLISVLETLPAKSTVTTTSASSGSATDTHSLVWDLLLAMPTNPGIIAQVHAASSTSSNPSSGGGDNMAVEPIGATADWSSLLDITYYERSVYVMQILDSFLRPCPAMFSSLSNEAAAGTATIDNVTTELSTSMNEMAKEFRTAFITSGGFEAVLRLFIASGDGNGTRRKACQNKMGNTCALRIIKECFFSTDNKLSNEGREMIARFNEVSMSNFLRSLVGIVTNEDGIYSDNAILRVLQLTRMLLESGAAVSGGEGIASSFTSLPNHAAETFLRSLLLWNGPSSSLSSSAPSATSVRSATNIRSSTEEMILAIPLLSTLALPWLIASLKNIDPASDGSDEFFSVLLKLVKNDNSTKNVKKLRELGNVVCAKLASYPRPSGETAHIDHSTGVLCGCLQLLIALIEVEGSNSASVSTEPSLDLLVEGASHILQALNVSSWSNDSHPKTNINDKSMIDLIGCVFDGFISSASSSGLPPICCDSESRKLAFNVISAAAQACSGGVGYSILSSKINTIIAKVAPTLRHKWGHTASVDDGLSSSRNNKSSRYSGLKNQGCTCYMNSVLQQLFMMPELRKNICSAELPSAVRSCGDCGTSAKGGGCTLVGKKISVHWENGNKYDAEVVSYNEVTGMHIIQYCPIMSVVHNQQSVDTSNLPRDLPEEYILSEGRPGKETGAFDILVLPTSSDNKTTDARAESKVQEDSSSSSAEIKETPDEVSSRKLLEEVQRTFVNLDEGSRGRCFDPRALVEASHCLKLEFDVWQQNDASEYAIKLLDRLEIPLKKWSAEHFRYLAHTFGMKKTTQKICKECGLKSNREEPVMNIDCQIRNMSSIHESLSDVCVDQIMEGDNKVLCDSCKVKTNTILRTAISTLPNMLVLSLKRFDLDFTTFETVKLNNRCEFGEALNMKQYTLQAKEALEAAGSAAKETSGAEDDEIKSESGSMMDLEESETKDGAEEEDPLSALPDDDYEYKLAGVLVHAGVAQGGHYYSFIKDRTSAKWYRFDDEDVTPFDPLSIERECFGGTVKKETKFQNGHTHTVEQDQFANALMLFYEKVKPVKFGSKDAEEKEGPAAAAASSPIGDATMEEEAKEVIPSNLELSNGYDVFLPEVRKSNSTHSWQSFLLTEEFQSFVKEILDLCTGRNKESNVDDDSMDITPVSSPSPVIPGEEIDSWRLSVFRMSLSFVFDVLFHLPLKKEALDSWSKAFVQIFSSSSDISALFVSTLAAETKQVNQNRVRTYIMECPEEGPRQTALQIFAFAITSLLSRPKEQELLQTWTKAWTLQVAEKERLMANKREHVVGALPTKLIAPVAAQLEDIDNVGETATSIGIILSFLSELIEVSPRYTQTNIDVCFFIRELASAKSSVEAKLLRDAMVEAKFIERLTCLATGSNCDEQLRMMFPGSSMDKEIATTISRNESHSTNILQMNNSYGDRSDHAMNLILLEAIGCLLGMPWIKQETVFYETGTFRGRPTFALTPRAIESLTKVYEESSSPNGMTMRDVQVYLRQCGQHVPNQRIHQIFERHGIEDNGQKLLYLKGFLAYYRDLVSNSDLQVQRELFRFGFRPDLTRRDLKSRWFHVENGQEQHPYTLRESIAYDVASNYSSMPNISSMTQHALQQVQFLLFSIQNSYSVSEYLLAGSACCKDTRSLMLEALSIHHKNISRWSGRPESDGNAFVNLIFQVLTAIPDSRQEERINMLMMHNDREDDRCGLMIVGNRIIQDYPQNYHARQHAEKFGEVIQQISKQRRVAEWMKMNRRCWAWMSEDPRPEMAHPMQARGDHSGRRGGQQNHYQNHDQNALESEDGSMDEEDDLRSDDFSVDEIMVEGCGVKEINGVYKRSGVYDGVPKYVHEARYNGRDEEFSLFRCRLTDNTRRWYISIVPTNSHPGTTKDIDFYAAVPIHDRREDDLPPRDNWMHIPGSGGSMPAPIVYPVQTPRYDYLGDDDVGDNDVDENQVGQQANIVLDQDQHGYL